MLRTKAKKVVKEKGKNRNTVVSFYGLIWLQVYGIVVQGCSYSQVLLFEWAKPPKVPGAPNKNQLKLL